MDDQTSRLSRLTAILTMLLSKQLLTSTEISKKFNISVRTVYRDIRALEEAGVPVITEEGKGYSIMDGYKLPPVMFTEKEAYALITTELIVLKSKDASLVKEFSGAVAKIKAVLKNSSKEKAELLSERTYIGKNREKEITSENLIALQMALTSYQLVKICYQSAEAAATERVIEPFVIYNSVQDDWTLVAYCRMRKDFRSFRLDRMTKVEVLEECFEPHKLTMKQYAERFSS
jgi:predicted DNA-binding transcriptional regulator YafY